MRCHLGRARNRLPTPAKKSLTTPMRPPLSVSVMRVPSPVTLRASRWAGTAAPRPARRTPPHLPSSTGSGWPRTPRRRPAAGRRAAQVADAAEDSGGERLQAEDEADVEAGVAVPDRVQERGGARQQTAEQED